MYAIHAAGSRDESSERTAGHLCELHSEPIEPAADLAEDDSIAGFAQLIRLAERGDHTAQVVCNQYRLQYSGRKKSGRITAATGLRSAALGSVANA